MLIVINITYFQGLNIATQTAVKKSQCATFKEAYRQNNKFQNTEMGGHLYKI